MTCAACVASVERVLSGVDGVASVSVNLPLEKAIITLDTPRSDDLRATCITTVEAAGFGASELVPALKARRISEEKVAAQRRRLASPLPSPFPCLCSPCCWTIWGRWDRLTSV